MIKRTMWHFRYGNQYGSGMYGIGQSPEGNFVRLAEGSLFFSIFKFFCFRVLQKRFSIDRGCRVSILCIPSFKILSFFIIFVFRSAVASVANMLNSTHNAVFSSFRAVIGVVEQFSILKKQVVSLSIQYRSATFSCPPSLHSQSSNG